MSSIDDRIVKMHWDASDFDNGCKNTMAVLMQMQQQLNNLAGNTADLNVSGLNAAAESVASKFTWLGKIVDDVMEDVARKIVNVGETLVKAFTIDPIMSGLDEYQLLIDSMKVIDANLNLGRTLTINPDFESSNAYQQIMATGSGSLFGTDSYAFFTDNEKTSMETIEAYLEDLNKYADKTKYSFMDMTDAFGQFIKAGVNDIDKVYDAIVGLSNLSALSGATRDQNSRAMYNASQVLSNGYLNLMDYRQFTRTQGLGKLLNDYLVQAAADLGRFDVEYGEHEIEKWEKAWKKSNSYKNRLKEAKEQFKDSGQEMPDDFYIGPSDEWVKEHYGSDAYIGADGKVYRNQMNPTRVFSDNTGKTKTTEEILEMIANSHGNLSEVVKYKVFDSEVFLKALTYFSDETLEIGQAAYKAATEVRSAKELWDVVTESAGSGWTNSWKHIIGENPEEATKLWTTIYHVIDDVLTKSADARNLMLDVWHDSFGRKNVIKGLGNVYKNLASYIAPLKEHWDSKSAWAQLTAEERGQYLARMSRDFRKWSETLTTIQWRLRAMKNALDLLHLPLDYISSFFEHGGGKAILGILSKALEIGLKVANLEAKAITRLFADNDPGELLANYMGVFEQFFDYVANRLKEGKDGFNKILFDFFQAAMRPIKWILDSIQRVDLDDVLNILIDAFDTAVVFMETITAGFNQAFDNINVDMLAEFVDWLAQAAHRWREFFDSAEGMELLTAAADTFFSFFRMGLDFIIAKWRIFIDVIDQIAEALQPFITKYITPILHFLGPIMRYAGKIALAFEKWIRESGIVYKIVNASLTGLGKVIDTVIDGLNKVLGIFGVQLPKLDGSFDPNAIFGDPDKWVPDVMNKIVAGFEKAGSIIKQIPKLFTGELTWKELVESIFPKSETGENGVFANILLGDFGTVRDRLKQISEESGGFIAGVLSKIFAGLDQVKKLLTHEISFTEFFENIKNSISFDWLTEKFASFNENGGIFGLVSSGVDFILGKLKTAKDAIIGFFTGVFGGKSKEESPSEEYKIFAEETEEAGIQVIKAFDWVYTAYDKIQGFFEAVYGILTGDGQYTRLLMKGGDMYIVTLVVGTIKQILKKLGNFNKQIDGVSLSITKAINSISGSVTEMFKDAGGLFKDIGGAFRDVTKPIGESIKGISDVFTKTLPKTMKVFNKQIPKLTKGFTGIMKGYEKKLKSEAFENVANGVLKIAVAIGVLAGSLWLLSKIPEDKLKMAAAVLVMIAGTLTIMAIAIGKFTKSGNSLINISKGAVNKVVPAMDKMSKGVESFLKKSGLAVLLIGFAIALGSVTKNVIKLSKVPIDELVKGIGAVAVIIGVLTAALVVVDKFGSTSGIGQSIGTFVTMLGLSIAVNKVAKAVVKLSKIEERDLVSATLALSALMAVFSIMTALSSFTKNAKLLNILALTLVVHTLSSSVISLSKLKPDKLIPATLCLSLLMGMFSLMEAMAGKVTNGKSLIGIVLMGVLVAGLAYVIYQLVKLPTKKVLTVSASLSAVLLSVSAAMLVASIIGKSFLASLGGILLIGLFIGGLAALLTVMGNLFNDHEGWMKGLETGVEVMGLLGKAIGDFVGNIFSSIAEKTLDGIGNGLEKLGESVKIFADSVSGIDPGIAGILKDLAVGMLAMTGAELLNAIATFFSGGNPYQKFAQGIADITEPVAQFSERVGNVGEDKVTAAANAAKMLGEFAKNLPRNGGLIQKWVTGDNSLVSFAKGLAALTKPMIRFLTGVGNADFNDETIERAIKMAGVLTAWAKEIPNDGGLLGLIVGNNNIGSFGKSLGKFTTPFVKYLEKVSAADFDEAVLEKTNTLVKSILEWAVDIPNKGGLISGIIGDNTIDSFGKQLGKAAPWLVKYSQKMKDFDSETVEKTNSVVESIIAFSKEIPNNSEGSLMGLLFGDNSIDDFGANLAKFGRSLVKYSKSLDGVDVEAMTQVSPAIDTLVDISKKLPDVGGLKGVLLGNKSYDRIFGGLETFGKGLNGFSQAVKGTDVEAISNVLPSVESLITLADELPNMGGLIDAFKGEKSYSQIGQDLENFGLNLSRFGQYMSQYSRYMSNGDVDLDTVTKSNDILDRLVSFGERLKDISAETLVRNTYASTDDDPYGISQYADTQHIQELTSKIATFEEFGETLVELGGNLKSYYDSIKDIKSEQVESVNTALGSLIEVFNKTDDALQGKLLDTKGVIEAAQKYVVDVVGAISDEFNNPETTEKDVTDAAEKVGGYIINGLNAGYYQNADTFTGKGDTIASDFIGTFTKAIDSDKTMVGSLTGAIDTVMTEAYKRIDREYENYKDLGSHLISGVIIGVNKKAVDLYTVMHNVAVNAYNEAANAVQVKSPSRLFMKLGEYIDLGWIAGVEHYQDDVESALVDTFRTPLNTLDALMTGAIDFQPVISPILDLSSVRAGAGQLSGFFSDRTIRLAEINDQIQNQQKAYKAQIEDARIYDDRRVVTAIGDLNSGIRAIPDAISKMGVSIDGRSLVGSITPDMNKSLGQSKIMAKRGRL